MGTGLATLVRGDISIIIGFWLWWERGGERAWSAIGEVRLVLLAAAVPLFPLSRPAVLVVLSLLLLFMEKSVASDPAPSPVPVLVPGSEPGEAHAACGTRGTTLYCEAGCTSCCSSMRPKIDILRKR